jgi:hypothetical protein
LLIIEAVIPEGNSFSTAKLIDLEVFVMGGGCERTESEFRRRSEKCGVKLPGIVPTQESISVIECFLQ